MTISLPTPENHSGTNNWSDVYSNDKTLKEAVEELQADFASAVKPITWYTPKIIATEESRTNTAFGVMGTPDEITNIVLPTNGLIVVGYTALVKCSASAAGRAALFLGSNQVKIAGNTVPEATQASIQAENIYGTISTTPLGLRQDAKGTSFVTTGQILGTGTGVESSTGGFTCIFAAAGTYTVSVQYSAISGSVTAKERKLWVVVLGD